MPAQQPGHGTGPTWTERMAALAGESAFRVLVADPAPGPVAPLPLPRSERRAARRRARRAAAAAVTVRAGRGTARPAGVRMVGPLARGAVVALTAGVLVGGDLVTSGAAGYGGVAGTIAPSSAERLRVAQTARLEGQALAAARSSRAESLALATAALQAAAAVRPLTSGLAAESVPAELGAAVERLSALVDASRPTPQRRMRAEVPLPVATPDADAYLRVAVTPATSAALPAPAAAAAGSASTTDPAGHPGAPAPLVAVEPLPDLVPLQPLPGADLADGVATTDPDDLDDASHDLDDDVDLDALDPAAPAPAAGTSNPADAAPVDPMDPAALLPADADVADLAAATGSGAAPAPGDDAAAVDVTDVAALPDGGAAPEEALTQALADTAGAVFGLSMEVERLANAAQADATLSRVTSLESVQDAATSADDALTAFTELEPLTPLTPEERRALAEAEEDDDVELATTVRSRTRLRGDTPAAVVALMDRWQNGRIPADALCAVPFASGHRLQCDAAAALVELDAAYREEFGRGLSLVSSYRPYDVQVSLRAEKGGLAAVPGTSNHGWGIAVDLGGIGGLGDFDEPGYLWLQEHAADHGWYHPRVMEPGGGGPQEPWHWEFGTA